MRHAGPKVRHSTKTPLLPHRLFLARFIQVISSNPLVGYYFKIQLYFLKKEGNDDQSSSGIDIYILQL